MSSQQKKEPQSIESFLNDIAPDFEPVIRALHDLLDAAGCSVKLQQAKSGHVVSYTDPGTGRAVINFVSRKAGPVVRIYADHVLDYLHLVDALPDKLLDKLEKASICRRLHDPAKCNARCPMGYTFPLRGEEHKKCRYNAFMFPVTAETLPHIQAIVERELQLRAA